MWKFNRYRWSFRRLCHLEDLAEKAKSLFMTLLIRLCFVGAVNRKNNLEIPRIILRDVNLETAVNGILPSPNIPFRYYCKNKYINISVSISQLLHILVLTSSFENLVNPFPGKRYLCIQTQMLSVYSIRGVIATSRLRIHCSSISVHQI